MGWVELLRCDVVHVGRVVAADAGLELMWRRRLGGSTEWLGALTDIPFDWPGEIAAGSVVVIRAKDGREGEARVVKVRTGRLAPFSVEFVGTGRFE